MRWSRRLYMAEIVWLASYPKSGNTWMRVLLANYIRDVGQPIDINSMDDFPIASYRWWFDDCVGLKASQLDETVIQRLRPEVYRRLAAENGQTLFVKVHDRWQLTDRREPLFPPEITRGVVYIVRNPLDLVASYANHSSRSVEDVVDSMCDPLFAMAPSTHGLHLQLRQVLGSWSDHVGSWVDDSGLPIHLVRYEDMRYDPEASFSAVVRFCGLPVDRDRIRRAVGFSDFNELQRQEQASGFRERRNGSAGPFFRRGEVGGWRRELSAALARRVIDDHGPMMNRLGYLD